MLLTSIILSLSAFLDPNRYSCSDTKLSDLTITFYFSSLDLSMRPAALFNTFGLTNLDSLSGSLKSLSKSSEISSLFSI